MNFFKLLLSIILFLDILSAGADVKIKPLEPTPLMKHETKWLIQALEQAHYNKVSLDDLNSSELLQSYFKKLDAQKLYFTAEEIEKFHQSFEPTLKSYFKQGNLFPAFEIFNHYQLSASTYLDDAISKLDEEINLESNNTFHFDRSDTNWSSNANKLRATWDKMLKNELIKEVVNNYEVNASTQIPNLTIFKDSINDAKNVLRERYQRWKKSIQEFEAEDIQELFLSALTQSFDPHTSFMNIKEKEKFDQAMNNEFVGIGAVLTDVDGYCTIKELLPGGPAEASRQLSSEDIILKVAQSDGPFTDVVDMKLSKIVELIKGPKDTIVRLEIKPIDNPSSTKIVSIVRDKIKLTDRLAKASLYKVEHSDEIYSLGVIELPSFYGAAGPGPKATDDVEELIESLKKEKIDGLILDLRRNGGGYLSEAVNLAGLFISRGPVVQVKSTDGKIRKKFDFDPKLAWNNPLIVLVSRYSASASEIVAGALKNHKRAIIVGDTSTHGKGTVQSLLQMNLPFNFMRSEKKGSAAKITIQKYYLPSGESTQIFGVKSDISFPSVNELLPIGESDLDNALEWDSIAPVNHRRPQNEFVYSEEEVQKILSLSKTRQESEDEFLYIERNIDLFENRKNRKSTKLDLKSRILEKVADNNITSELDEMYESLTDLSFPMKEIQLEVVKEQIAKSREVRGFEISEEQIELDGNYTKPESLDIRLHETLRIMSDWVTLRRNDQISKNLSKEKEI